jgi:fused signal recognition particle receptor
MSDPQSERIVVPIPGTMPRKTWLDRLGVGLAKSSKQFTEQVAAVLTKRKLDQDALDELEEMLIEADLGPAAAARVTDAFGRSRFGREVDEDEIKQALAEAIAA